MTTKRTTKREMREATKGENYTPPRQQPHRVLILCDLGINRSVTLAGQLKFLGNEVLTAGVDNNTPETLLMLVKWADTVIFTAKDQKLPFNPDFVHKYFEKNQLWDMGPDAHPRPYNPTMLKIAKDLIKQHPEIDHRS